MKKIFLALLLVTSVISLAQAQAPVPVPDISRFLNNERVVKEVGLTEEEVTKLVSIYKESAEQIKAAKDIQTKQTAELKKLLLEEKVNMSNVEKVLRAASEAEYKIRLINIKQMVLVKEAISKEKWAKLQKVIRTIQERIKENNSTSKERPGKEPPKKEKPGR